MTTITGYIARETEKAIALVMLPLAGEHAPLWIPRSKVVALNELDQISASVQLKGEKIRRLAVPVEVTIDAAFAAKVGIGA
jgi:hypothetical protein